MKWLPRIVIAINVLAAVALLGIGAGAWVLSSERGTAWLVEAAARRAAPALTIGAVGGTLAGELELRDLSVALDDSRAEIESLRVSLALGQLLARAVVLDSLHVGAARVTYVAAEPAAEPAPPPRLPVALVVRDAEIENLTVTAAGQTRIVGTTRFAGSLIDSTLEIGRLDTSIDGIAIEASGRVGLGDAIEPALDIAWSGELLAERWAGAGTLTGTWPELVVEHALTAPVAVSTAGTIDLETDPVVDVEVAWTDLTWPGLDRFTSPRGSLSLAGGLEALRYRASGRVVADGVPVDVEARGTASAALVELEPLELFTASGSLLATGRFEVAERRFRVSAQGRDLDPSLFASDWPGRIDAEGELSGVLEPALQVAFEGLTLNGRVRDYPFTAALDGGYRAPGAFTFERAEIESGQDRVSFTGTVEETIDLRLEAHAQQLDLLWPELEGVVDADLSLAGTPAAPRAAGSLEVADLRYGRYALDAVRASGSAEIYPGGALDVTLEGRGLDLGNLDAATVAGRASGTMQAHTLTLSLEGPAWRAALGARGALADGRWDGRLERLDMDQDAVGGWRLADAVPVSLAAGSIEVQEACLGQLDAELCGTLRFTGAADDRLALRAHGFDLQWLAPLLPEGVSLRGVYALDADFTNLSREPTGRLSVDGGATRVEFAATERDIVATDIDDIRLTASLEQRRLALDLTLDGRDTGRVNLEAAVDDVRDELSPIRGRLEANWSDLAVLSLLSPDVGAVSGALQIVLDFAGTLDEPEVQGRAAWTDGAVEVPAWGVSVDRIDAGATSADGSTLEFDASGWVEDAELRLTGSSILDRSEGWPTELSLTGENVPVVQLPDAEIYVSPELTVDVTLPRVNVEGTVRVPRARLSLEQLPEQAVRPSGDAVVHGLAEEVEPVRPLDVSADIRVVLGDDVTYSGSNLDTTLGGDLRLLYASGQTANASGSLSIDGSYDAYGQSLDLDRGELIFTGPLDDPTLDVRAVRTIGETTVGVQLSGSLKAPQTRMFSDPAMSEADALSYLLLGRPLGGSGDEDSAIVQSAALSMGLQQALPVVQRIGETLGFDEFSIETNDVDTGALMAGKYLSPKIYIRYSYGLFNRIGGLLLRFKINERLSLETRSGDEKSMDLLYTVEKE